MPRTVDQLLRSGAVSNEAVQKARPPSENDEDEYNRQVRDNLLYGEYPDREGFVAQYGYENALGHINNWLGQNGALKGAKTGGGALYDELQQYRDDLLARQGS